MASIKKVLMNRRMLVVFLLGFSSGIPLALVGGTLQAWMASLKIDLTLIGIFSLVGLPYTLKFLWAPIMDRYVPPFLGRRRGWIIVSQLALVFTLIGMAFCDPVQNTALLAMLAVFVAFSSASQDIVIDAYKTEILEKSEFGVGAATATLGYRLAMLFSGAVALILSDHMSWTSVYLFMAASIGIGIITTLLSEEPSASATVPKTLKEAVVAPFLEFFKRKKVVELLTFIIVYKMDVVVAVALMTPFMMELGFSRTDIGAVTKGFGLVATLVGTFVGGALLSRIGIKKSLWLFGILQGISGICFYLLAKMGHNYPMMVTAIAAENFFSGMGTAAYAAFLMSLCNPKFTATQFALLTSLMALTRTLAGAPTGWLAKSVGWETYFIISILLMIPGLLLLTRFDAWMKQELAPQKLS
jgi:MFS transporter, PAT family, beta-lactamase induction signal transducer AmpG